MDLGVLLSVPLESVAVRAVLASVLAVVLARALLRGGLRSPRARVATALAPAAALLLVLVWSGSTPRLPLLMLPAEGAALPIPVRDGYLHFSPMAIPLLAATWASIVVLRLGRRVLRLLRIREAARTAALAGGAEGRIERIAAGVADRLRVPAPRIGLVARCPGGAYVVGGRRPIVVLGRDLVTQLDDAELEGVLAHELAHVRRRDTLVAGALGTLRDLTFFVPGGGWATRQLHRERELAADQLAVDATGRPGALAGGLLKVLETGAGHRSACAALAPSANLVDRVRVLVDESPAASRRRRRVELLTVCGLSVVAVVAALVVPGLLTGTERDRDALAVVWSATQPAAANPLPAAEARAFDVYRRTELEVTPRSFATRHGSAELSQENRRAALHACADERAICPVPRRAPSLGLQPPVITVDAEATARWRATAVGGSGADDGLRMFWLYREEG